MIFVIGPADVILFRGKFPTAVEVHAHSLQGEMTGEGFARREGVETLTCER
jgi:hypothetical protein